jgi:hypothetical protein
MANSRLIAAVLAPSGVSHFPTIHSMQINGSCRLFSR